jgi:gamma-glutamylaminecyclotransferase
MNTFLFVYGSLKEGFHNHYKLVNYQKIGKAITSEKYCMYAESNNRFPYVIKEISKFNIKGELYKIDETLLKNIDIFEGTPIHYIREEITVLIKEKEYKAFIYFKNQNNEKLIMDTKELDEWNPIIEF